MSCDICKSCMPDIYKINLGNNKILVIEQDNIYVKEFCNLCGYDDCKCLLDPWFKNIPHKIDSGPYRTPGK